MENIRNFENKPFPDIPLLPEERDDLEKTKEGKLPGAPSKDYESILLSLEEGLPLLDKVGKDIDYYSKIQKSEQKKAFRLQKMEYFLNNPKIFESYFDTLRILNENWEEKKKEIDIYTRDLFSDLEKNIKSRKINPEAFKDWISLMVKSDIYKPIVENIIRIVFNKPKDPKGTVGVMYDLTESILTIEDLEVLKKSLEILMLQSSFMEDSNDLYEINYSKALFSTNDDDLLQKALEIDSVIYYLGPKYAPEVFRRMEEKADQIRKKEEYLKYIGGVFEKYPEKMNSLFEFYNVDKKSNFKNIDSDTLKEWPYNLVSHGGNVRKLFNERIGDDMNGKVNLYFPTQGEVLVNDDNTFDVVSKELEIEPRDDNEFKDSRLLKMLFYLTPKLNLQNKKDLSNDVVSIRQYINLNKIHGISPRGDKMLVSDERILDLGFRSITFKVKEHAPAITTVVEVKKYKFIFLINSDLSFKDIYNKDLLKSIEQRSFLEHLVLSYLKELMCTEKVKVWNNNENSHDYTSEEKEFISRRPHLRKMPPGHSYTTEALILGLQDPFVYNLEKINQELGLTKERGQKTYVRASEKISQNDGPIISKAPEATNRLYELLRDLN